MRLVGLARWVAGCVVLLAATLTAATTVRLEFAEVNGQAISAPPFPTLNVPQVTPPAAIPSDERVVAARIWGWWGTFDYPDSTAPVEVYLDGILVAQCKAFDPCWADDRSGRIEWSRVLTPDELIRLRPANPQLTVVQKEPLTVRLGASTLIIETAPPPAVPTLAPAGLLALLAAMAAAGASALRRSPRG